MSTHTLRLPIALAAAAVVAASTLLMPAAARAHPAPPAGAPAVTGGVTRLLTLESAPNPAHPQVLVHAPPGFDPRGRVNVAVFLHGMNNCIASVVASERRVPCQPGGRGRLGLDALTRFDAARTNALLVVPQLAFDRPSNAPGRFGDPGGLRALLAEVLAHPELRPLLGGRARSTDELGRVVLLAHSGGYYPASTILTQGGVPVHEVVLFDALFGMSHVFREWAREVTTAAARNGTPLAQWPRLVLLYAVEGGQAAASRRLVTDVARSLPPALRERAVYAPDLRVALRADPRATRAMLARPLVAVPSNVRHGLVPNEELEPVIATAALPRSAAPAAVGGGPPASRAQ